MFKDFTHLLTHPRNPHHLNKLLVITHSTVKLSLHFVESVILKHMRAGSLLKSAYFHCQIVRAMWNLYCFRTLNNIDCTYN